MTDVTLEELLDDLQQFGDVDLKCTMNVHMKPEYRWCCYILFQSKDGTLSTSLEFYESASNAKTAAQLVWLSLSAHINAYRLAVLEQKLDEYLEGEADGVA